VGFEFVFHNGSSIPFPLLLDSTAPHSYAVQKFCYGLSGC
jgi:hypothetical protein